MRIAVLTEIPAPFRIPLFNELAAREDVDLDVAFLAAEQPWRPYALHEDEIRFPMRVLAGVRVVIRGRWLALSAGVVRTVARADVVVVGGWNQPAFWQAAATARLLGRPFAVWVESTARDRRSGHQAAVWARRLFITAADAAIVPGTAAGEYARALGARRVVVAPNAVDAAIFGEGVDRERARRDELRAELEVTGCCFLAIGRLSPEKGFDVLARASADVPGADVLVVGAGPEEARLRALAPPSLRLLGVRGRNDLPALLAAADAVVVPSRSETWGMTISEAATAGLPIVATQAAGAAWDLIDDGVSGYRVPPDDPAALADAMRSLVDDPAFREAAGRRSRELASRMTAAAWADQVRDLAVSLGPG